MVSILLYGNEILADICHLATFIEVKHLSNIRYLDAFSEGKHWLIFANHIQSLQRFHQKYLKHIINVGWLYYNTFHFSSQWTYSVVFCGMGINLVRAVNKATFLYWPDALRADQKKNRKKRYWNSRWRYSKKNRRFPWKLGHKVGDV